MLKNFENWLHKEHAVVWCRMKYIQALFRNGFQPKTVLFYPERPKYYHMLYSVCNILGYRITNNPTEKFDLAVAFQDITVRPKNTILEDLIKKYSVVNANCVDISKERVEKIFEEVFGYGMAVDPRTYQGEYVRKSDANAVKDAVTFNAPMEPEKKYVYQRLIDNRREDNNSVLDMRAVVFKDTIPVAMTRVRSIPDRFIDDTVAADLVEADSILSSEEQGKILAFCKRFGLDYGELDILRDKSDGKIYIVDVNSTPGGPVPGRPRSAGRAACPWPGTAAPPG